MCWSETATLSMVGIGAAATIITARRGEPKAIWLTLGYFTVMEVLQAVGYTVVDDCGSSTNQSVTLLSYLHIALQPIFINAFVMAVMADAVTPRMRRWVYTLATLASLLMLARLAPFSWAGHCAPGDTLCGPSFCTVSGDWHIAWQMPLNDIWGFLGEDVTKFFAFPSYGLAVFALPLAYGAWRFVLMHAVLGPGLASVLTSNSNETPTIWCLFSIGLLMIGISPFIRRQFAPAPARA